MKSALVILFASAALAGCAVVPVAPPVAYGRPVAYGSPQVALVAPRVVIPTPVVVVTPWYHRWWWRR